MKKTLYISAFVALCFAVVAMAGTATIQTDAEYHVQRNGVEQFCAPHVSVSGSTLNFTGDCEGPPPVDPTIISIANVSYRGAGIATNVDVTQFANIFGRAGAQQPIQQYPYVTGSTPSITVGPGRSVGPQIHMPSNPGTSGHTLKTNSYGSTGNKPFRAKLVPIGGNWSTAVWRGCEQNGHQFSENATIFNIRIGPPPASPNASFCYVNPGATYVVLMGWMQPGDGGVMTWTWY